MTELDHDAFKALKSLAHGVGRKIWLSRIAENRLSVIGVHFWSSAVVDWCKENSWSYDIPEESTVRRRIDYLASDPEPLWVHVGDGMQKFNDLVPRAGRYGPQSCYVPSKAQFPEEAALVEEAMRKATFEKRFGRAQGMLVTQS